MLTRVLLGLLAAAALLGGERRAHANPPWEATLLFDPWADTPEPRVRGSCWATPTGEIVDPWEHAGEQSALGDELELVDPWPARRPRIPTASFPAFR
jgi:hypothetical protein